MNRPNDTAEIKQALKERIGDLCGALLPGGRPIGRLYVANNPVTNDHQQTPEFKVALNRDIGAWIDYRTGDKGDVIRLIEYTQGTDFAGAMQWARDFLGIRAMSIDERRRFTEEAKKRAVQAERQAEKDTAYNRRLGEKLFMEGYLDGANSTAEALARAYFEARGCPLDKVPNRDTATMRFAPATEYWKHASWKRENGRPLKVAAGPSFPAVHSAFRVATGQVIGCHCTFLDPLKAAKAPVAPDTAKLMRGEAKGAVIRISHGPENLPPEEAVRPHPLILCEGIEDGLSLAISVSEARVWAAGSLANIANAPVDLPCISAVYAAIDNDWEKETARRQLQRALEALAQKGKPLSVMASHAGKDFNDLF